MPKQLLYIIAFCCTTLSTVAQIKDGKNDNPRSFPAIEDQPGASMADKLYRTPENPYYWKNRKPDAANWQQDVQYNIYAKLHEEDDRIEGAEQLVYWNNSPDELQYVYFHLYQNAFIKGSHLFELERANKVKTVMGKYEAAGLGIVIDNVMVDNHEVKTELDNTILKVYLPKPLKPGGKVVIRMGFDTYFDLGSTRRRMQMWNAWGFIHYNGCQWYPKLCVYDRMHGWDTYQHLNREFYGDFGIFDVMLDFPNNYVLEATGVLQNRSEVLPDTLREKLDIKNFASKKWEEPPSIITPYEKGKRKVWHYVGNNVHDFAWTADPSYRLGTANWNGIECVAITQEPHAARWQNAPEYMTKIIKTFSRDIGMYCYPKIVAADARDGMEYPMITMDGGGDPGYRGLLIHEIGHNWFYGQVGSNETYRAAMDEGFTQFLTAWGLHAIEGEKQAQHASLWHYRRHFAPPPVPTLDGTLINRYAQEEINKVYDISINTHSDDFHSALGQGGGYGLVYFKTGTMLYNLEYVLGDSLFQAAMHHYFEQWKFAHPYFEDFRASIIQFTGTDLSWFFDEWFETTKTLDYGIRSIHKIRGTDSFAIRFRRKGEMQMPIDFTVTAKNGSMYDFHIPNTWFQKSTTATILPKWTGWGKLNTDYVAHVQAPGGIRSVQIDTSFRLADKDMVDDYKTRGLCISPRAIDFRLDGGVGRPLERRKYHLEWRPDLWWNSVDGIKAGAHIEGNYMQSLYNIDATVWWNTHALQETRYAPVAGEGTYAHYDPVNYTFNYYSAINRNTPSLQLHINSRYLDGLWCHRLGLSWLASDANSFQVYGQTMWRPAGPDLDYLTDPADWSSMGGSPNSSLDAAWSHRYNYFHGSGRYTFSLMAPMLTPAFDYSYAQLEAVNYNYLGRLEIRTRVFGRYGAGSRLPSESLLYMAGASPEDQMENKYTRSQGFIPTDWQGISRYDVNHFQQGGGLGLRGYAGYYAPDERHGYMLEGYKGRSGAAVNMEIGFENYMPWRPRAFRNWLHAAVYGFGDAGVMELSNFSLPNYYTIAPSGYLWSNVHVDAGVGMAFTIRKWWFFDNARPLTLRLDLPVFLNRPPYSNDQYATLRYVIGVNRAF
jgi:aminopeptidase N